MRVRIDRQTDALYFRLDERRIVESEEVRPGIVVDYDDKGQVIGVEFLDVSKRAPQNELASIEFTTT